MNLTVYSVFHKPFIRPTADFITPIHAGKLIAKGKLPIQGDDQGDNISNLNPYFKNVIISEDVGINKPDKAIFEYALDKAKALKPESIMIGDSIEADIRGAQGFGIEAIFFNPQNKETPNDVKRQITHLEELLIHF